jgi:AcrR family transcriptional regulator
VADADQPSTRQAILIEARRLFADDGYDATSLNDIAAGVGIKRASVLHHFPSKEAIRQQVLDTSLSEWIERVMRESDKPREDHGWPYVDDILTTAFRFFMENPELVAIVRREALNRRSQLAIDLAAAMRPMFQRAAAYFEREMDRGTYRRFDAEQLLLTAYALLSYFSDLPFIEGLLDRDPLDPRLLEERLSHIRAFVRAALMPGDLAG